MTDDHDARRRTLAFRAELSTADLLDAAEDLGRVLEQDDLDLTPATRDLLFAVDEAITAAFTPAYAAAATRSPTHAPET